MLDNEDVGSSATWPRFPNSNVDYSCKESFVNHFKSKRVCAGTHNLNQTQLSYDIWEKRISHIIDRRGFNEIESDSVSEQGRISEKYSSHFRGAALAETFGFLATTILKSFPNYFWFEMRMRHLRNSLTLLRTKSVTTGYESSHLG